LVREAVILKRFSLALALTCIGLLSLCVFAQTTQSVWTFPTQGMKGEYSKDVDAVLYDIGSGFHAAQVVSEGKKLVILLLPADYEQTIADLAQKAGLPSHDKMFVAIGLSKIVKTPDNALDFYIRTVTENGIDYQHYHTKNGAEVVAIIGPNRGSIVAWLADGTNDTSPRLSQGDMKEAREVLLAIDAMETRLKSAWNEENDFGATTNEDRSYLKGAANAAENIASRLNRLPDGDYKIYLSAAAVAYVDVGRIRSAAGQDEGEKLQLSIAKNYKLENREPHLWAWDVWQIARAARNRGAKALGLPERKYDDSK
jgi:hypothetical protein